MYGMNIHMATIDELHKIDEDKPKRIYITTGRSGGKGLLQLLLYTECLKKEIVNMVPKNEFSFTFRSPFEGMMILNAGAFEIKDIIVNHPATIVLWEDGTKTVVKCENEEFDLEKAIAMAFARKALGNKYGYYNVFKKWLKKAKNFSSKK